MTDRLARGSLPWPAPPASGPITRPACRGSITVETAIEPGARLRITAWPRSGPDGPLGVALELEPYPAGGRKPTAHNPRSEQSTTDA